MKETIASIYALDLYISHLEKKEYLQLRHSIGLPCYKQMPLLAWEVFIEDFDKKVVAAQKSMELQQVLSFAKKYKWKNDLEHAFSQIDYEALIITDKNQNIIWVNNGFTEMTGYTKKFALNKTPRFLQGENTSIEAKKRIRKKITQNQPFQDVIVNHRKDKIPYKCEVTIIPLYHKKTTHFMAFEKEII
ncbi:MAG: PAS domain-containing protein [Flavobacteriaceae bacterium]|nr:PAS domain-containing protein [Flavobacteriaceae bacterium]